MPWPSPPSPPRLVGRAALCAALLLGASGAAAVGESDDDELDRWVPALSASIQVHVQDVEGAIDSGDVLGTPLTDGGCLDTESGTRNGRLCDADRVSGLQAPLSIVPDSASEDLGVAAVFGASLELMSPRLTERLFSPRLFGHVDASLALAFERNVAGERSPGRLGTPQFIFGPEPVEISYSGQGSRAKTELQPFVFSTGVGTAFSFEAFGRRLRLKPSFEYLWQQQKLIGVAHRLVKFQEDDVPPNQDGLDDLREVTLDGSQTEDQHGVGFGLELEADSGRIGPILFSPFIWGRGYRVVSDNEFELVVTNSDPDGRSATGEPETVTYRFDIDPWVWRAGVGIRMRFVPK